MNLMRLILEKNDLKAGILAILAFATVFVFLKVGKRWVLGRVSHLSQAARNRWDTLFVGLLIDTKFFFIFSLALFAGLNFLTLPPQVDHIADKILFLISMLQIAIWGTSLISFWIEHYMKTRAAGDVAGTTALGLINSLTNFLFFSLLFLLTLNNFGVDITALLAGLGVGGIAVALAVRNILGDLLASLTIVLDKPFVIGDLIHVGDLAGYIERIGLKTTRIRSLSGEQLIFPNADLLQSRLKNYKRMMERRATFPLHVVHQTPHSQLQQIPRMIKNIIDLQPLARFERSTLKSIGTFSMEFETVYWVKDNDYNTFMRVHESICMEIIRQFRQNEIEFAHPTQTLHIHPNSATLSQPIFQEAVSPNVFS